jgi:hypothetical protein
LLSFGRFTRFSSQAHPSRIAAVTSAKFGKTEARVVQSGSAPVGEDAVDYESTAGTLRMLLAQTGDKAKMEALRLILVEVEAENARLSHLIEDLRTQGLLL